MILIEHAPLLPKQRWRTMVETFKGYMHKSKSATSHWSRFRIEYMFGFCDWTNRCPRRRAPCGLTRDRLKKFTLYMYSKAMVIGVSILYINIFILSGWELENRYRIQIHVHHTISPKAPFDPCVWGSFQSKFAQFGMDFLLHLFNNLIQWYC